MHVCETLLEESWLRDIISQSTYVATLADGTTKSWKNTNRFLDPNDPYYNEKVEGIKTGSLAGDYWFSVSRFHLPVIKVEGTGTGVTYSVQRVQSRNS